MNFVLIKVWSYSQIKSNSKSVRKKVYLLKLMVCA